MHTILNERAIIAVSGSDRFKFLQGLLSNDVEKLHSEQAIYACMLTPQGKYFVDMFLTSKLDAIMLDVPLPKKDELLKKLNIYKLRSEVVIKELPEYKIVAFIDENVSGSFVDPRSAKLGHRAFMHIDDLPLNSIENKTAYDLLRINNFIAEGEKDLVADKSFLLEYGFDELNAIDYNKGCYIGQELVARTHYTGVIRKQIAKIKAIDGDLPANGSEIYAGEQKLGVVCSSVGKIGLALLRSEEALQAKDAISEGIKLELIFKEQNND